MTKNFDLSQYDSLRNTGSHGVCFIACIDWAGNNMRGNSLNAKYYTDRASKKPGDLGIWSPYIAQQNQYLMDRLAYNLSHYEYLKKLLALADKTTGVTNGLSKGLRPALSGLAVGQSIVLGIHFSNVLGNFGHAVAFYMSANGLVFFDPNFGEFTGTPAEFELFLSLAYPGFAVNTIAELRRLP